MMIRFRFLWIGILLFWCYLPVAAQELIFENLNAKIALPSTECYSITQDRKGYLWIATEQGLVRYGGAATKVFAAKENLAEKAVYAVKEDAQGTLWVATAANRLKYLQKERFVDANLAIQKYVPIINALNQPYDLKLVGDQLYVHSSRRAYQVDIPTKKNKEIFAKSDRFHLLFEKKGGQLIHLNANFLRGFTERELLLAPINVTIGIRDGEHLFKYVLPLKSVFDLHWRVLTCQAGEDVFITVAHQLIKITKDWKMEVYPLPSNSIALYPDKDAGVWVGTAKKGVYYFRKGKLDRSPLASLRNYSVSGISEDREGNIWCTTLEDGVYFSTSKHIKNYTGQSAAFARPVFVKEVNGKLFISTETGGLFAYTESLDSFIELNKDIRDPVTHLYFEQNRYYISNISGVFATNLDFGNVRPVAIGLSNKVGYMGFYGSTDSSPRERFSITYDRIVRHGTGNSVTDFLLLKSIGKNILYLGRQQLLYGCANGLYVTDISNKNSRRIKGIDRAVNALATTADGATWIATNGDGLYLLKENLVRRMDQLLGMGTEVFNDLCLDRLGRLWLATNKGLICYDTHSLKQATFNLGNGLPADEIYKIAAHGGQLFFSSGKGLGALPIDLMPENRIPPLFSLNQLETNSGLLPVDRTGFILPANNNRIKLSFNIISFRNELKKLSYRLKDDQPFVEVKGNEMVLQNLKPDQYQLTVYALNGDDVRSMEKFRLQFSVEKPFWQKMWFIALCLVAVIFLFFLLRKWQIARIQKREKEKSRINNLIAHSKLEALKARMNPHFIFNAINSIQNYILKNQSDAAQDYLTKFSRLIRFVLSQSAERTITLKEELDTLKLYVELEKLRFKDAFDYQIIIDPALNTQTVYLPTMLIQPYVENAIWHGLMNLKGQRQGHLKLEVLAQAEHILVRITDNGIGRQAAAALGKAKQHVSVGMLLTQERLKTLQDIFPTGSFHVSVTDLQEGTSVTIILTNTYDDEYEH